MSSWSIIVRESAKIFPHVVEPFSSLRNQESLKAHQLELISGRLGPPLFSGFLASFLATRSLPPQIKAKSLSSILFIEDDVMVGIITLYG